LVVDDTEEARRLIRRILQAQGNYTIMEAVNGHQAIDIARKELPDLVILDLMMPSWMVLRSWIRSKLTRTPHPSL